MSLATVAKPYPPLFVDTHPVCDGRRLLLSKIHNMYKTAKAFSCNAEERLQQYQQIRQLKDPSKLSSHMAELHPKLLTEALAAYKTNIEWVDFDRALGGILKSKCKGVNRLFAHTHEINEALVEALKKHSSSRVSSVSNVNCLIS